MSPQLLPSVHIRWSGPYSAASLLKNENFSLPDSGFFQVCVPNEQSGTSSLLFLGLCRGSITQTLRDQFTWMPQYLHQAEVLVGIPEVLSQPADQFSLGRTLMERTRDFLVRLAQPILNEVRPSATTDAGSMPFQVFNWGTKGRLPEFAITGERERVMALRYH